MSEVLSPDEIDQLLTAVETVNGAGVFDHTLENFRPAVPGRRIKIYDFKRPDKFSKENVRTLSMIFDNFSRLTTTNHSAQLRSMVHIHVASVDQLTYEEFIRSVPTPTTLAIFNMDPLNGNAILELDPAISVKIINHLFGCPIGFKEPQHELTHIDEAVMECVVFSMFPDLKVSFENIVSLVPRIQDIVTNPQFAQVVPWTEMVVLITLEVKIGNVEGMINFCFPYSTIESIVPKLTFQDLFFSEKEKQSTARVSEEILESTHLDLTIEVGKGDVSFGNVLSMKVGDTFKLSKEIKDNFTLKVGGVDKFSCKFVGSKYTAVEVVESLDKVKEIIYL